MVGSPWILSVAVPWLTQGSAFVGIKGNKQYPHQHRRDPPLQLSWSVADGNSGGTEALSTAELRSVTFSNLPKDQEPDVLSDFLMELGACSVSITDAEAGTPNESPLFREPSFSLSDAAWADSLHWAAPIWNSCNVTAHFPASTDLQFVMDMLSECFPHYPIPADHQVVPDKDWVVHVQSTWNPVVVDNKFILRFPWHSEDHVQKAVEQTRKGGAQRQAKDSFIELLLQGGIAFGTGEHATTQLCLEWLNEVVPKIAEQHNSDDPIMCLDYGAGSGVLGMSACRLDPRIRTVGVDIDLDACRIANENAQQNEVNMHTYLPPVSSAADDVSRSLLLKAQQHALLQLSGQNDKDVDCFMSEDDSHRKYHVCVANILAGPLVALAPTLASFVKPGGYLGLSGILSHLGDNVAEAYSKAGFEHVQVAKEKDGWVLVTGQKQRDTVKKG